ncbi:hypothetical protein J7T55_000746 [Diaporthe amygdali]|uniref:uncharacterized protein n=1 Tax=Phomopsis amygdali TaxID=1214568 RepID=UPI0022FF26AF|nr:uncharacterized protein J7T55_000746 [Diaporthe amygdali]KAJ0119896.1 hypothetical protein J7T55_000746 [Diaporthe amygdali]
MAYVYNSGYEYDSDGSDVRYEDLDERGSDDELRFELQESFSNPALVEQGGLRSYETKKDGTVLYYADRPSDYSIVADRLLWVDGYESTMADGQHGREMTLVVLKIKLFSADRDSKFKSFTAELSFKDKVTGGEHEPLVEAWAPFRTPARWNPAVAQREVTDMKEGGAKAGYQGAELSAARSREKKMSWDQVDFDEGNSGEMISQKTGRRNGVRWSVTQNDVSDLGVTPEIWVAVLLSRTSQQPYGVRFRLYSRGGSLREVVEGTKRFFGTKPDETKPFSLTPWKRSICHSEGKSILEAIDLNNLGKLRGVLGTDLILPLGPDYRIVPPESSRKSAAGAPTLAQAPAPVPAPVEVVDPRPAETGVGRGEEKASEQGSSAAAPAKPTTRWHIPADPIRLAAMESRVAHAEARIATLESTILELREALYDIKIKV